MTTCQLHFTTRMSARSNACCISRLRGRRMLFVALSASAVVALAEASTSGADLRIVSPAGLAEKEGNDRGAVTNENRPFYAQYLFPAKDFAALPPGGLTIKSLALRPDGATSGPISTSFSDYHLTLSVTSRDSLAAIFADNFDEPPTTVYSGAATLSAQTDGPRGGPRPFEFVTLLQQPFHYDPTEGNLLLHLQTSSGWSKPYFADAQNAPANPPANTVVYRVGEANPVTGLTENYLPVVQFIFVPEPSSLLLGAFLVAGLSLGGRRRVGRLHV